MTDRPVTRCLSESDFETSINDRYFEDYVTGSIYEYGYFTVAEQDIVDFAQRFDPRR